MEKIQAFLNDAEFQAFTALAKRYGWKPGQVLSRLLRFYLSVQKTLDHVDVDQVDEHWGGEPVDFTQDGRPVYADGLVFSDADNAFEPEIHVVEPVVANMILKFKDGLTPAEGFGVLDQED